MSLIQLDLLNFIPDALKTAVRDTLVDFVSDQAKKVVGEELGRKLKQLRSDAAFNKQFEKGLESAIQRFVAEYELEDEDLVAALAADSTLFRNDTVQKALLTILKKPGAYLETDRETLVQSFEGVLTNRRNRERVDKAVTFLLRCLAEELWHLPELQPIYSLQFQYITADSTRQQVELQKAQLLALGELNSNVRDALIQLTDALIEHKLLQKNEHLALPESSSGPKVYHNLPQPDHGGFIGREKELGQVSRILRPYPHSQEHLVSIDGIGGIGKSALALEIANRYLNNYDRIPEDERFEAIIWTSAKQTILTGEGIVTRSQALRTLKDLFTAIAVALQREGITRAPDEEQHEIVRNALIQQRSLLIIDNLETVDDEAVLLFLRELPAPTKAIVTTRHRIDVAYPVRLTGMPWNDAQRLIAQECQKKGVSLTENQAHQLYERTGGVPLAMVWSIAKMGLGYDVEGALRNLGSVKGDIARFCFEEITQKIESNHSFQLLLALSIFAKDGSREALQTITQLPELDCEESLAELVSFSLVNRVGGRFSLLPLTKEFCSSKLTQYPERKAIFRDRTLDYFIHFLSVIYSDREKSLPIVEPEFENIIELIDYCEKNEPGKFTQLVHLIFHYLWLTGKWLDLVDYLLRVIEIALETNDTLTHAYSYYRIAGFYMYQGHLEKAKAAANSSIILSKQYQHIYPLALSYLRLGAIHRDGDEYAEARRNLDIAVSLTDEIQSPSLYARVYLTYASVSVLEKNYQEGSEYLEKIEKFLSDDTTLTSWWYRLKGEVAIGLKDFGAADNLVARSLEIASLRGSLQNYAQTSLTLAKLELEKGNTENAKNVLRDAIEQMNKLGMTVWLRRAAKLREQIEGQENVVHSI